MAVNKDISEEFQYDVSYTAGGSSFDLTDIAYDISFNDVPFILKADNQNPYRRETAQYKKDQFDNSQEPGEQSLTGWWVRSQTSWHNGAGIEFYELGTDYEHVSHRFYDSRGIDVWTVGEMRLHKNVFHAYTAEGSIGGFNAATGQWTDSSGATPIDKDCLIVGDESGILKRVTLNGNSSATVSNYTAGATYPDGHSGSDYPFLSIASNGSTYYAVCSTCVHKGTVNSLTSDDIYFRYHNGASTNAFAKYARGVLFFAHDNKIGIVNTAASPTSSGTHTSGTVNTFGSNDTYLSNFMTHSNPSWIWTDITGAPNGAFASGVAGNRSEVYKFSPDRDIAVNALDMAAGTEAMSLPQGELVNSLHYYLGYLVLGTNKGVRVCPVDANGDPVMGPLLVETSYSVNGFTERGSYIYAATKADNSGNTNGILIRIDLSQQFSDGTFAYAYDLEYESTPDSSNCTEVYNLRETQANGTVLDRLVMVIEENGTGELQVEHTTNYRSSGYLQTGKIRYGTVEPKFFKYLQTRGLADTGDSIGVQTIDYSGNEYDIITLDAVSLGQNVGLSQPIGGQEFISIKYIFNNGSPVADYPVLQSYQLKSVPGVPRQRLYQYPLSCFDTEMDKYNMQFGYSGRAYDVIRTLEELETTGDFVSVKDYRTNESFQGVIEEVRFISESSPDKDSNGFGGLLLVTVRKL
jgi:hypothetical protein